MALVFMALGIPVYIKAHKEQEEDAVPGKTVPPCFTRVELMCALLLCAAAVAAIVCFATKIIKL